MMNRLNGWQRLWVVTSILLGIVVACKVASEFPLIDPAIMADIRSPESKWLREMPEGFKLDKYPEQGTPCRSFAIFRFHHTAQVQTVDQYKGFVRKQQTIMVLQVVAVWLISIFAVYILGWAIGWIIKGFKKKSEAYKANSADAKIRAAD